jgi:hypothetical protein
MVLLTPQTVTDVDNIATEIISWQEANPNSFLLTSFM